MSSRPVGVLIAACLGLGVLVAACGGEKDSDSSTTTAAQAARSDSKRTAQIWAVGDGADGGGAARRVARMIERAGPDRVLYLGDVYESGTAEEFERNWRPVYGELDDVIAPTPGNHDWGNHEEGYDRYFAKTGIPTNRHHYSFKTAGWEVVSLNSEAGLEDGSPQRRWLRRALSERGTCRIAFLHRPFLNAGRHGDQRQIRPLWRALRGRAAIVLSGHDHNMQRFKRRDGLVQFISGAGGHHRYESDENDPRLAWDEDDEYGALRLDLRPGVARFRFVAPPGRTLDSGTIRCRRPLGLGPTG
ncbi:MAG: metallophosphoesterase family protein [Solirubrobacterales bacterium]